MAGMQQTRLARFPAADFQIKRIAKRTSTRSEPISMHTIRGQLTLIEPIEWNLWKRSYFFARSSLRSLLRAKFAHRPSSLSLGSIGAATAMAPIHGRAASFLCDLGPVPCWGHSPSDPPTWAALVLFSGFPAGRHSSLRGMTRDWSSSRSNSRALVMQSSAIAPMVPRFEGLPSIWANDL